jgi:ABC-type amino acid transport substrate-binding protein
MTGRSEVEERLAVWLLEEAPDEAPTRVLDAAFEQTRSTRQERRVGRLQPRWAYVLAAVLVLGATLFGLGVAAGWIVRTTEPQPRPDALERITSAGVLRVAVRPDRPQVALPDGSIDGFDVDVARELARRLGVRLDLVPLTPAEQQLSPAAWDVALPSTRAWALDATESATGPYYAWPHLLVVPAASGATSVADVTGQPICAVTGDAGQAWVAGRSIGTGPGAASTAPVASTLVLRASDAACLAELESGTVRAVVTADLLPADAASIRNVSVIAGPDPEPRVAVVQRSGGDEAALVAALDRAIRDARADGTLAAISRARFGIDLTTNLP